MAVWSIIRTSAASLDYRCDAEFFHPEFLNAEEMLQGIKPESLAKHFKVSDGNHLSVSRFFDSNPENIPYFRGQDLNGFFLENASPVRIPRDIYLTDNMRRSHFVAEDVLMCIVGASTGTISFAPAEILPSTGSCKIGIFRKREDSPADAFVLAAFFLCRYGQNQVKRHIRGTAQGGIILKDMFRLQIPVFESEVAEEIRRLLEASLNANRSATTSYQKAQQILESELGLDELEFEKQVGFAARFSELEESRRADAQHYQPRFAQLMRAVERHNPARIRAIRTLNRRGVQPEYVEGGDVAAINSQHLGPNHLAYDSFARTSRKWFELSPFAHVQPDDLLIYTTGAYVGRTNVYLDDQPALASNHVNIIRLTSGIDAAYMALVLQGKVGQFQTAKHARGSAQAELYPADIDKFLVPLLPASPQAEIGDLVRTSLKKQRESKSLLEQAKARVEQLIEEAVAKSGSSTRHSS